MEKNPGPTSMYADPGYINNYSTMWPRQRVGIFRHNGRQRVKRLAFFYLG